MRTKPALALSAAAAAVVLLAGCSSLMDPLHGVHTEAFVDRAAAEDGWVGVPMPSWIPEDSTEIRTTATTNEQNAVIAVTSDEQPIGCEPAPRVSLPFDGRYGGIDDGEGLPEEVLRCGAYEVAPTADGWIGWFTATEEGQTPEDV
ncbi:hypothetical protein [Agrococcus sp. SGAir0287]|uniref:hypothetical protein n=1 Tax=Agrococcus sp. SGAir0287 TaxID=2070347 RepID=UPI0010CCD278|nr:hypothetical protein [Agrococcus sp. SGAir0287]QCR18443.1 hypothetical protein C1N71_02400 [Agrococcus sp. SGAir0287]